MDKILEKEYIIHSDKNEFLRLIEEDGKFILRHNIDGKKKTITLDEKKIKTLMQVMKMIYPEPQKPKEPMIRVIAGESSIISMEELNRYLKFATIQDMIDSLPDTVRFTPIGNDRSKALVKMSELFKNSSELKALKTPKEV